MIRHTVKDLAEMVQGRVLGDETRLIDDTRALNQTTPTAISFAVGEYAQMLGKINCGAVIVEEEVEASMPLIIVPNAKAAFATILKVFHPDVKMPKGIHPTAVIGENVSIGKNVTIRPYAVIEDNASIGDNVIIYPHVYIGHNTRIGSDAVIYPHAVVHENCVVGERVVLRAGAIVGGEGFGFATQDGKHTHIPQVGNVVLEDDVEIGSCSCIDCATLSSTIVRRGTKIDNLVHLGHNVEIGEDSFLCAQVGIAGSVKSGKNCTFAGQVGSTGHITIGDNCLFAARTGITGNVPNGARYAGFPMREHREWLRIEANLSKLAQMNKTIKALEKEIEKMKNKEEE